MAKNEKCWERRGLEKKQSRIEQFSMILAERGESVDERENLKKKLKHPTKVEFSHSMNMSISNNNDDEGE